MAKYGFLYEHPELSKETKEIIKEIKEENINLEFSLIEMTKPELIEFAKKHDISTKGTKQELTERIKLWILNKDGEL